MKRDLVYAIACLAFAIIIGGAVYEHLNVVPVWAAAPPVSLSMFQGKYGLRPDLFWKIIHPVTILLFVLALAFNWKYARRSNIIVVLSAYILILVVTAIYFVPELISITSTPFSNVQDADLVKRASLWERLSIARLAVLVILAIKLFMGLTNAGAVAKAKRNRIHARERNTVVG
ncbi:hypothetical protein ACX0G7_24365 [Flavitalea antarctica]